MLAALALVATVAPLSMHAPAHHEIVLAFSRDGLHALVEERTRATDGTQRLRYAVLGKDGRELVVTASALAVGRFTFVETVEREACRDAARALEDALDSRGFDDVRVRASGCARPSPLRDIVDLLRSTASSMAPSPELEALQKEIGGVGMTFVSDDGPLVVILVRDPNDLFGAALVERTFLRKDPRVNKRWLDP